DRGARPDVQPLRHPDHRSRPRGRRSDVLLRSLRREVGGEGAARSRLSGTARAHPGSGRDRIRRSAATASGAYHRTRSRRALRRSPDIQESSMPVLRSATALAGRNNAAARALFRATGVAESDLGKPVVAIANSYTQFVPGHVHLKDLGELVAEQVAAAGAVAREFHTIAVDDGIAMGHLGMLYSLPSRELIADSVEYMVNAHCESGRGSCRG